MGFVRTSLGAGGVEQDKPLNLRQFVPQAAELARQRQLSQRGPRHDISTLRTALRLGRQVCMHALLSPSLKALAILLGVVLQPGIFHNCCLLSHAFRPTLLYCMAGPYIGVSVIHVQKLLCECIRWLHRSLWALRLLCGHMG